MQPTTFLARPRLWLEHLGRHGTAFTPAPNFGYQLCVERLGRDDLAGIDLAPWQNAMTGAEMVRPETVQAFCDRFGPRGFRPEAFRPCYGLAEGTLAVTFDQAGLGMRTRPLPAGSDASLGIDEVVSVGTPIADTTVQITDPAGHAMPAGTVGEVWVRGPSIFAGYWHDAEATAKGLQNGWLVTGDLGFLDQQGELYLTGRRKDILVVRGHNIMPHELEWLAESVTGGGGGIRSGAFSITHGADGEQAVLVGEATTRDPEALAAMAHEIRSLVGRQVGLPLADLIFVRRGRLPKTTSGKVQRRQLRARYLEGTLDRLN
jgi:acyl-CoA synthetase (AMP-forming)/AMP-acid ligase II